MCNAVPNGTTTHGITPVRKFNGERLESGRGSYGQWSRGPTGERAFILRLRRVGIALDWRGREGQPAQIQDCSFEALRLRNRNLLRLLNACCGYGGCGYAVRGIRGNLALNCEKRQ